jgi:hypothetical protein
VPIYPPQPPLAVPAAGFIIPTIPQVAGSRFFPVSTAGAGTSGNLSNNGLRLMPFVLPNRLTLSHVGADIATAGEAGSVLRLGIYNDNGSAYPGSLLIEAAATVAGDSATVQEVVCSVTLDGGKLYWVGGAVQGAPTTQPVVRTNGAAMPAGVVTGPLPSAGLSVVGYFMSNVSGALPATFTTTSTSAGAVPRVHFRLA